ncbi:MAG: cytochrome c biogenesis protein ResB [Campylobacteraceae bacterium]|nr:cytochrome c biogenesis protein ResB [Campylobacteraceae bacterium]
MSYKEEKKVVELGESSYELPVFVYVEFNDFRVGVGYGPIAHKLPFSVDLKRFDIVYYPGGYSPATYSSLISIDNKEHSVGMNAPFRVKDYAFYQSSYSKDSTTLWVNKDPGKWPTYFGYALLFLGLILNIFDKKSRIRLLVKRVRRLEAALGVALICSITPLHAGEYEEAYLNDLRTKSIALSDSWGSLVVQTKAGRMKPLDTLSREILSKISGKESYQGLSASQVLLGMFTHQNLWKRLPLIKVKTPKLKEIIGLDKEEKLAKFEDFFTDRSYKLEKLVGEALKVSPGRRSTFDKDLIAVDERLNVALMSSYGAFFKIIPDQSSPSNSWKSVDAVYKAPANEKEEEIASHIVRLMDRAFARNFEDAMESIVFIDNYAKAYGEDHYLDSRKLKTEII